MNSLEIFKIYEGMIDNTKDIKLLLRIHHLTN